MKSINIFYLGENLELHADNEHGDNLKVFMFSPYCEGNLLEIPNLTNAYYYHFQEMFRDKLNDVRRQDSLSAAKANKELKMESA